MTLSEIFSVGKNLFLRKSLRKRFACHSSLLILLTLFHQIKYKRVMNNEGIGGRWWVVGVTE